jgi:hypothetical protein
VKSDFELIICLPGYSIDFGVVPLYLPKKPLGNRKKGFLKNTRQNFVALRINSLNPAEGHHLPEDCTSH